MSGLQFKLIWSAKTQRAEIQTQKLYPTNSRLGISPANNTLVVKVLGNKLCGENTPTKLRVQNFETCWFLSAKLSRGLLNWKRPLRLPKHLCVGARGLSAGFWPFFRHVLGSEVKSDNSKLQNCSLICPPHHHHPFPTFLWAPSALCFQTGVHESLAPCPGGKITYGCA